jgi:hypothetical protein
VSRSRCRYRSSNPDFDEGIDSVRRGSVCHVLTPEGFEHSGSAGAIAAEAMGASSVFEIASEHEFEVLPESNLSGTLSPIDPPGGIGRSGVKSALRLS